MATAVAMVATFCQIGWLWLRGRKIDKTLWVSLAVITVFGGATLISENETFIKWKPTVLYWLFGVVSAGSALLFRKNFVRSMMAHQVDLPEEIWGQAPGELESGFFTFMGALNRMSPTTTPPTRG